MDAVRKYAAFAILYDFQVGKRVEMEGDNSMLVAKKEVSKSVGISNRKPMIRKNQSTGEMVAGFLDPATGEFEVAMEINDERDIDDFLDEYDLSVVMISKM